MFNKFVLLVNRGVYVITWKKCRTAGEAKG
jgi:hypothetical protein